MSTGKNIFTITSWNVSGELSWMAYREGYKKAADTLARGLLESEGDYISDVYFRFGLIYPIMFLYRHYMEVEFKDLLAMAGLTNLIDKKKIRGHDLGALWSKVLELVDAVQAEETRQEFVDGFGKSIEFFERVDSHGDGFRYPKNIKGRAQWDTQFEVDLGKIYSNVNCMEERCDELRRELKAMLVDPEEEDGDAGSRYYFY